MKFIVTATEVIYKEHEREIEADDRNLAAATFLRETGRAPDYLGELDEDGEDVCENHVAGQCEMTGRIVFEDEDYRISEDDCLLSPEAARDEPEVNDP